MDKPHLEQVPITNTAMLIRRPAGDVFEAFVDPDFTTKFWFTTSSGRVGGSHRPPIHGDPDVLVRRRLRRVREGRPRPVIPSGRRGGPAMRRRGPRRRSV